MGSEKVQRRVRPSPYGGCWSVWLVVCLAPPNIASRQVQTFTYSFSATAPSAPVPLDLHPRPTVVVFSWLHHLLIWPFRIPCLACSHRLCKYCQLICNTISHPTLSVSISFFISPEVYYAGEDYIEETTLYRGKPATVNFFP